MCLELVKQVSQVEQATAASVRQAAQQAQQMQEEAERAGRALVEQTRRDLQQLETQRRRQAAEDAGGSLHLCRSGGVPVFWRRLRRRYVLLAGAVLALVLMFIVLLRLIGNYRDPIAI